MFASEARPTITAAAKLVSHSADKDRVRGLPDEAFDEDVRASQANDIERIGFASAACGSGCAGLHDE